MKKQQQKTILETLASIRPFPRDESEHVAHMTAAAVRAVIELAEALRELHDGNAEYSRLNHLGAYNNHDMRRAREAMTAVGMPFDPVWGTSMPAVSTTTEVKDKITAESQRLVPTPDTHPREALQ